MCLGPWTVKEMKYSSILMICSSLVNAGVAGMFYFFALSSYQSEWLYGAIWQIIIGSIFAVVSIVSFRSARHCDEMKITRSIIVLAMVAFVELLFSFLFSFFAFSGEFLPLWRLGIPLLLASVLFLSGFLQRYRETRNEKLKRRQPRKV